MTKTGKQYLIAMDLEGIHGIVGVPYEGLSRGTPAYAQAVENAVKEVNVVVNALFDNGASKVVVWDNHGGGNNLDFSRIDRRAIPAPPWQNYLHRIGFASEHQFDGLLFLGYHARAGSFNGVLAHTYSSKICQYIKVNGELLGEYEIDSYIAGEHNIPPIFAASDDVSLSQIKSLCPTIQAVVTKVGKGRNVAELIDEQIVLDNLAKAVAKAVQGIHFPCKIKGPVEVEIRYTRSETAEYVYDKFIENPDVCPRYGADSHTLRFTLSNIQWLANHLG